MFQEIIKRLQEKWIEADDQIKNGGHTGHGLVYRVGVEDGLNIAIVQVDLLQNEAALQDVITIQALKKAGFEETATRIFSAGGIGFDLVVAFDEDGSCLVVKMYSHRHNFIMGSWYQMTLPELLTIKRTFFGESHEIMR